MIKAAIVGGAGYTGGELIRILLNHPGVEITWIHSSSHSGQPVHNVHTDLLGETEMVFSKDMNFDGADVLFLCMGHGRSGEFMKNHSLPPSVKIIDLSHDFRLKKPGNEFVYGLPEMNRPLIREAKYLANPGCFATSIQMALLPLAASHLLNEIHVHAITGSTGAGQAPTGTTHFSWRNNNVSVYKAFQHQHLGEIVQSCKELMPAFNHNLNFVPMRGNFSRGILASVYLDFLPDEDETFRLFEKFYLSHPFVTLSRDPVNIKQVVNTNKCLLHLEKHGNKLHVISVIDNLTKGASGQAVQNMNLMFGLNETDGLLLKPVGY